MNHRVKGFVTSIGRQFPSRLLFSAALLCVASLVSCGRLRPGSSAPAVNVVVNNRAVFDVNVFVMRSPLTTARRLGSVTAGLSDSFKVQQSDLQAGGQLVLAVRAIAGRAEWVSHPLAVGMGSTANLDIISTGLGDLSQTRLYQPE